MPAKSTARTTASESGRSAPPLNSAQIELLRLFERPLTAQQLQDIKLLLSKYLADQVDDLGTQQWHSKELTDKDMDTILKSHIRTPYRK